MVQDKMNNYTIQGKRGRVGDSRARWTIGMIGIGL